MYRWVYLPIVVAGFIPGIGRAADGPAIDAVEIAPLFYQRFACTEHVQGELTDLGDALGSDCFVLGGVGGKTRFIKLFRTDGTANEDWYGWHAEIHAPFDGLVTEVVENPITNKPGIVGKSPPGYIKFQRADGVGVV